MVFEYDKYLVILAREAVLDLGPRSARGPDAGKGA